MLRCLNYNKILTMLRNIEIGMCRQQFLQIYLYHISFDVGNSNPIACLGTTLTHRGKLIFHIIFPLLIVKL